MYYRFPACFLLAIILLAFIPPPVSAQVSVVSNNGFVVNIVALPTNVLPSSTNCPYGYNYNLRIAYTVTMVGVNPQPMYTLQGTIRCGSVSHFFDLPNNGGIGATNSTSNPWQGNNSCNTATVLSLNCNTARIEIEGPGISARTVTYPLTYAALPVKMVSFTAAASGSSVRLAWQTASEENSDHFVVERSADGDAWTAVASVDAAGDSDSLHHYQWLDNSPLQGFSYYRLKIEDRDGKYAYSEVRVIQAAFAKEDVSIYPVPNRGRSITISGIQDISRYRLTVTNSNGIVEQNTAVSSTNIQLPALKPGVYILSLYNEQTGNKHHLRYVQL